MMNVLNIAFHVTPDQKYILAFLSIRRTDFHK
jgi:hypothetical protein